MFDAREMKVTILMERALNETEDNKLASIYRMQDTTEKILDGLEAYWNFRKKALEEGLKLTRNTSVDAKGQTDKWKNHFSKAGEAAHKMLVDMTKGLKPPLAPYQAFARTLPAQESGFFNAISGMPMPGLMHGAILEHKKTFEKEQKRLRDIWKNILSNDKSIDAQKKAVVKDLLDIIERELKNAANKKNRWENWIGATVKALYLVDSGTSPATPSNYEPLDHTLDAVKTMQTSMEEYVKRFRSYYKSEETITIILYGNTRKDVKEFLDKINFDKAAKTYVETQKKCNDIANGLKPEGQKEDAVSFVTEASKNTKDHLEKFEDAFEAFVKEFKDIFVGQVSDKTAEELIERKAFGEFERRYNGLNIQTQLKRLHDDSRKFVESSISGLSSESKKVVREAVRRDLEKLSLLVNKAADFSVSERMVFMVKASFVVSWDKVKRLKGWLS